MATTESDWELHQPAVHREQAAEHRRAAERLARAGDRDQASRLLMEARLLELKAAAFAFVPRAA